MVFSFESKKWWDHDWHVRNMHEEGKQPKEIKWYECHLCDIKCNTPEMLKIHLGSVKHLNKEQALRRLRQMQPMKPLVRPNSARAQLIRGWLCPNLKTCFMLFLETEFHLS